MSFTRVAGCRVCKKCMAVRPVDEFGLQAEHKRLARYCDRCFMAADASPQGGMYTCRYCRGRKPIDEFGFAETGSRKKACRECQRPKRAKGEPRPTPPPRRTGEDEILGGYRPSMELLRRPLR